ncbi:MAG: hypothetical protein JXR07_19010 [Reichenbachiella sp.]
MKLLRFIPVLLLSCAVPDKIETYNIAVVEKYIKAVEKKDFNTLDSLTHERFYIVGPSLGDTLVKRVWLEEWKLNTKNIIEKVDFTGSTISQLNIPSRTEMGDWIGEWSVVNVQYKNLAEPVKLFANSNFLVVDGKVAKVLVFYNAADVTNQLGYIYSKQVTEELDSLNSIKMD